MEAIGEPGLQDSHLAQRADFCAGIAARMRHLGRGGEEKLLAAVEQDFRGQVERAGCSLLVAGRAIGLAVEELPVNVEPVRSAGREEALGEGTASTNTIRTHQTGQVEVATQYGTLQVAWVLPAARAAA